ncbi:MAG TPA: HlyD family efflux transporter periplasmic adaptor subunit [Bryobacteraceae bacterium]|jgi:multidrug resistance efflux pump|nr:HlyD family efflux transporter periplasmic adaptor subunit [Bryobacteraceae bacterium]
MDVQRTDVRRKKLIRRLVIGFVLLLAIPAVTIALARLKPAAPGVEMSTLWPDTVKRGPMMREVHGLGTLVPEETMLIPATTDGRVQRILIRPGTPVKANSIIMILTSPELETDLLNAEFALKAAEADYSNLKVTLEKAKLDMQATAEQVGADFNTAKLKADRDSALSKEGLYSEVDAKISSVTAEQLGGRYQLEQKRISINSAAEEAQLAAQQVKVEQLRAAYNLKKSQVSQLKVQSGFDGMLQQLPAPVEEGQKVLAGTPLGKVAQPSKLKAELKIAETQVKDIAIGQPAVVDTRNGLIDGHVSRIDPSILNGTVTVDVALTGALPPSARPDLSVDGTIQLEKLTDVLFVGRPVFGQQDATVQLFKVEPEGKYANKVKVAFGRSSVNTIEVKDGLQVGDKVILSDMSAYDSYDRIRLN